MTHSGTRVAAIPPSFVPEVRPHVRRRDQALFFMISRQPLLELRPEDVALYEAIDGARTVAELERGFPHARERLASWHQAEVVELVPPVAPPAAPHLVVVEPHMDDAVLSVGGRLLHRRGTCRITILSVVGRSNFTSYLTVRRDFLDAREVTELRMRESALAARMLGAEHRCLDWTDAPLRRWPAQPWPPAVAEKASEELWTFTNLFPVPQEVSRLAQELARSLSALAPDELWIPMGLGEHVDHRTTRSACIAMLAEAAGTIAHVPVTVYEELPYATDPGHAAQIVDALSASGARLVRGSEDVTDVFDEKLRLVSIYASQFKRSRMEPRLCRAAAREGGGEGSLAEAFYRLEGKPHLPPESHLARDWVGLTALRRRLRVPVAKRLQCRRLSVLALPSGHLGWWSTDMATLARTFPRADIRVYVAAEVAWQVERDGGGGLRTVIVPEGWRGWLAVLARELFRYHALAVVLWWGADDPGFKGLVIRMLLPFRRVILAKRLCDFCGVLNELRL